jgi:hypothetical protein
MFLFYYSPQKIVKVGRDCFSGFTFNREKHEIYEKKTTVNGAKAGKGRTIGGQPSGPRPSFVSFAVKFLQIWVFSRYLEGGYFPFSCLFAPLAVEFLKSKTATIASSVLLLTAKNTKYTKRKQRKEGKRAFSNQNLRVLCVLSG